MDAWVSDAEAAKAEYTAFASKKGRAITARLIVRRVRDQNKKAGAGQDELFPVWRYHAVFTDSPYGLVQAEGQHRDHAVAGQVFADVTSGPLAHMPSGVFAANAAWLSIAAMAHNLVRAAGALASLPFAKARGATIRRDLIAVAARTARHGRGHLTLHLPQGSAPRTGMAEPVGRGLRAARGSGLTSPEPVSTPHQPRGHPEPLPRPRNPGQAAQQASGGTPAPRISSRNSSCRNQAGNELPELTGGSRLSEWLNPMHRSRLCHFVIDVSDLDQGVLFWSAALNAAEEPVPENSRHIYRRLRLPDSEVRILLQKTSDEKVSKERMHLDLEADDVEAEVERLEALGATRWDHQTERGFDFWVLRDPWGNEFCVLQPEFPELLAQREPWNHV